jgi:hypothetical protein
MKTSQLLFAGIGLLLLGVYLRSQRNCGPTCRVFADGLTRKGVSTVLSLF